MRFALGDEGFVGSGQMKFAVGTQGVTVFLGKFGHQANGGNMGTDKLFRHGGKHNRL